MTALFIAGNAFHGCWVALWVAGIGIALVIGGIAALYFFGRDKRP